MQTKSVCVDEPSSQCDVTPLKPFNATTTPPVSCDDADKCPLTPSTPTSSTPFPSPYPIPDIWGEEVDKILKEKRLTPYARKEIVDTLCCSIKVYTNGRPTAAQCTLVARALVDKYHFLKDPIGCETVSFTVN